MFRKEFRPRCVPRFGSSEDANIRSPSLLRNPFPRFRRRSIFGRYPSPNFRPMGRMPYISEYRTPRPPMVPPENVLSPQNLVNVPYNHETEAHFLPPPCSPVPENRAFRFTRFPPRFRMPLTPDQGIMPSPNQPINLTPRNFDPSENIWVETKGPNGKFYYYNARTRVSQWDKPVNVRIINRDSIQLQSFASDTTETSYDLMQQNISPVPRVNSFQCFRQYLNPGCIGSQFPTPAATVLSPGLFMLPPPVFPPPVVPPPVAPPPVIFSPVAPEQQSPQIYTHANLNFNRMPQVFSTPLAPITAPPDEEKTEAVAVNSETRMTPETRDTNFIRNSEWPECQTPDNKAEKILSWEERVSNDPKHTNKLNFTENSSSFFQQEKQTPDNKNEKILSWEEPFSNDPKHSTNKFNFTENSTSFSQQEKKINDQSVNLMDIDKENVGPNLDIEGSQENKLHSEDCDAYKIKIVEDSGSLAKENETSSRQVSTVVNKSRPVSSTPIPGSTWCVVWTGDEKVFYYESARKFSVWDIPDELKNRLDVQKLSEAPPSANKKQNIVNEGPEIKKIKTDENDSSTIKPESDEENQSDIDVKNHTFDSEAKAAKEKAIEVEEKAVIERKSIPYEERVNTFRELLREKNIPVFATWEKELHKIVFDPRYLLLTSKDRKRVFESFVQEREEEEKCEKKKQLRDVREKYKSLLIEAGVNSRTRFSEFAQRYAKDVRFRAIEKMREKENLFIEFVDEMIREEKEQSLLERKQNEGFFELLREQNISKSSKWSDIEKNISNDWRYLAIGSASRREILFLDCIKNRLDKFSKNVSGKQEREDASIKNRKEEVKHNLKVCLQEREKEQQLHKRNSEVNSFKALLVDLVKTADMSWKAAKRILRDDHRWECVRGLKSAEREILFEEHISYLNSKKRELYHHLLDDIPEITLASSWRDVRRIVLNDPRCSKFSSSEKHCENEFYDYMKEKYSNAKADFRQLLKETKIITYKSKDLIDNVGYLDMIEDILKKDKRCLIMDDFKKERRALLLDYIDRLHSLGPPRPPTATEPRH